jgi:hypothetical protein
MAKKRKTNFPGKLRFKFRALYIYSVTRPGEIFRSIAGALFGGTRRLYKSVARNLHTKLTELFTKLFVPVLLVCQFAFMYNNSKRRSLRSYN